MANNTQPQTHAHTRYHGQSYPPPPGTSNIAENNQIHPADFDNYYGAPGTGAAPNTYPTFGPGHPNKYHPPSYAYPTPPNSDKNSRSAFSVNSRSSSGSIAVSISSGKSGQHRVRYNVPSGAVLIHVHGKNVATSETRSSPAREKHHMDELPPWQSPILQQGNLDNASMAVNVPNSRFASANNLHPPHQYPHRVNQQTKAAPQPPPPPRADRRVVRFESNPRREYQHEEALPTHIPQTGPGGFRTDVPTTSNKTGTHQRAISGPLDDRSNHNGIGQLAQYKLAGYISTVPATLVFSAPSTQPPAQKRLLVPQAALASDVRIDQCPVVYIYDPPVSKASEAAARAEQKRKDAEAAKDREFAELLRRRIELEDREQEHGRSEKEIKEQWRALQRDTQTARKRHGAK